MAWDSVVELTREIRFGWLIRLIHSNTASFVFIVLFLHLTRGLVNSSFYIWKPWIRGWLIMVLVIAAAFLGYVLPWGQMSFWGATVIINLLRVLPQGKALVTWLWGGFYVSSYTCRFFYALHYLLPLLVLVVAMLHLLGLHYSGRSLPGGIRESRRLKVKFTHIFTLKDVVNLILLWGFWMILLGYPDWAADAVNFTVSDMSNSPLHIQPEWYFLNLYAILRSIPNKVGGLVAFALALFLLLILSLVTSIQAIKQTKAYSFIVWTFLFVNALLIWLGMQPVEDPFIRVGQWRSVLYYMYILRVLLEDWSLYFVTSWA